MHCLLTILLHILISGNNHTDDHTYRHHNHHAAVSRGKIWISVNHQKTNSFSIFSFLPLRNNQTASQAYQFRPTFSYLRIFIRKRRCQRRRIAELAVRSTDIMALQLHVEKLRGLDNYKAWSMTVRSYLETEDLWSVVSTGPDGSDEDLVKDRRAKFIILCLIDTKLCHLMQSIRTSKDLWTYLKKQHSIR